MISLTRINDRPLVLNCDLIQSIERDHDTVVTLYGGEKLRVRETPEEIVGRVMAYRREVGAGPWAAGRAGVAARAEPEESHG